MAPTTALAVHHDLSLQAARKASERLESSREQLSKNQRKKLRKKRRRLHSKASDTDTAASDDDSAQPEQQSTNSGSAPEAAPCHLSRPTPEPQHSINASANSRHDAHSTAWAAAAPHGALLHSHMQPLGLLPHAAAGAPWAPLPNQQHMPATAAGLPLMSPPAAAGVAPRPPIMHPALHSRGQPDMSLLLRALKGAAGPAPQLLPQPPAHHHLLQQQLGQPQHHPPASLSADATPAPSQQPSQQQAAATTSAGATTTPSQEVRCRLDLSGQVVLLSAALSGSQLGNHLLAATSAATTTTTTSSHLQQQQPPSAAVPSPRKRQRQHAQDGGQQQQQQQQQCIPAGGQPGARQQQQQCIPAGGQSGARQQQQQQQQQGGEGGGGPSRKRTRRSYVYGNYPRYYGYRLGGGEHQDTRLQVLSPEWVQGADCLDIGCNEGLVTLALVTQLGARSAVGVDIDGGLVAKACTHLARAHHTAAEELREAVHAARLGQPQPPGTSLTALQKRVRALHRVTFRQGEWVTQPTPRGKYDLVTCLSVTKWVHLHQGDDGLMRLFNKMYQSLAPGGVLVLEPQPWSSYHTAVHKQDMREVPFRRYEQLKLRPDGFLDYLTRRVGFELVAELHPGPAADAPATVAAHHQHPQQQQQQQQGERGAQQGKPKKGQQTEQQQQSPGAAAGKAGKAAVAQGYGPAATSAAAQQQDAGSGEGGGGAAAGGQHGGKVPKAGFDRPVWVLRKPSQRVQPG